MEGAVYDISEWAACQSENLKHLQANTHSVQYRIVSGKKNPPSKRNTPEFPRFVVMSYLLWAYFQMGEECGYGNITIPTFFRIGILILYTLSLPLSFSYLAFSPFIYKHMLTPYDLDDIDHHVMEKFGLGVGDMNMPSWENLAKGWDEGSFSS